VSDGQLLETALWWLGVVNVVAFVLMLQGGSSRAAERLRKMLVWAWACLIAALAPSVIAIVVMLTTTFITAGQGAWRDVDRAGDDVLKLALMSIGAALGAVPGAVIPLIATVVVSRRIGFVKAQLAAAEARLASGFQEHITNRDEVVDEGDDEAET
jgi:hypothetical protein